MARTPVLQTLTSRMWVPAGFGTVLAVGFFLIGMAVTGRPLAMLIAASESALVTLAVTEMLDFHYRPRLVRLRDAVEAPRDASYGKASFRDPQVLTLLVVTAVSLAVVGLFVASTSAKGFGYLSGAALGAAVNRVIEATRFYRRQQKDGKIYWIDRSTPMETWGGSVGPRTIYYRPG